MPHPEAYISYYTHPNWSTRMKKKEVGDGYYIFKNCIDYFKEM
jgi:phosphoribosylformylglycinamidine (FGAM) synthase-like amidotransferase family enzyme